MSVREIYMDVNQMNYQETYELPPQQTQEQKKVQRGVLSIILVVITLVIIIGTFTFLSVTDYIEERRAAAAMAVKGPSVSLTILPAEEAVEGDDTHVRSE